MKDAIYFIKTAGEGIPKKSDIFFLETNVYQFCSLSTRYFTYLNLKPNFNNIYDVDNNIKSVKIKI
jgi:hypothetical protein